MMQQQFNIFVDLFLWYYHKSMHKSEILLLYQVLQNTSSSCD